MDANTSQATFSLSIRAGFPDFLDLPWDLPVSEWEGVNSRLEEVERGLSRHPVVFVNYDGNLYAIKELPPLVAEQEYDNLVRINELHLPAVTPVGYARTWAGDRNASVLITSFLDRSLPYRSLFMHTNLERYREHLLDAMAGLLVQLHLSGIFWGDCSLSNTLFLRDAGALEAYLVDAETVEVYPRLVSPTLRYQDLEIMGENVNGELMDLRTQGQLSNMASGVPILDTGAYIRLRYQALWEEITREVLIRPEENYRIQERIRALNALGFSVGEVRLTGGESGNLLRLGVVVTDRNFHRDQLQGLTGLDVQEMQARQMMNEIHELQALLSQTSGRSTPLSVASYQWLEHFYKPTIDQLKPLLDDQADPAELYCQVLEHKWYLSEQAGRDVGHQATINDFLNRFGDRDAPSG